ncbi:hypothetical protein MK139_02335 [bacterium]|nr:hypothetical protein [bacterium]
MRILKLIAAAGLFILLILPSSGKADSLNQTESLSIPDSHPNATRLFFAPTARMLTTGTGYLANHLLFFPSFAVGLSDLATLGGGFSILPGINFSDQMFFITPKVGFSPAENIHLAAGAFVGGFPASDEMNGTIGVTYGVGTVGPPERTITVGLGWGFANQEVQGKPMLMIGGEWLINRRASLITENWKVPSAPPVVSLGVRLLGDRFHADLALVNTLDEPIFPGIPIIGLVYAFGR